MRGAVAQHRDVDGLAAISVIPARPCLAMSSSTVIARSTD